MATVTENALEKRHQIATQLRRWILQMTTDAGSGHATSSLSAVELMAELFFGAHFRFDVEHPTAPNNDRLIFSKGHASPLYYALWSAAGQVAPDRLENYRQFGSLLEGHPTSRFPFTEAATGSLGQGLSVGVGMALAAKLDQLDYRTFVLLGDSEMSEGSQWEAIQIAAEYQLNNLVGVIDVNRLGQRGETMYGDDLQQYKRRIEAFGWQTVVVRDGHDFTELSEAYHRAAASTNQPTMLIARSVKGKGVSFLEDESGWHGKAIDDAQLETALQELGQPASEVRGELSMPNDRHPLSVLPADAEPIQYPAGDEVATRTAYGDALKRLASQYPEIVALDAEVSNSTRAEFFAESYPDRFFEMFIAEQNMVGAAVGLGQRGKIPFVSTFAAFLTRAFDQIRMARHSEANVKFVGSHCGVSIGPDGPSQMGLEDIAMFRTIQECVVLYPSDAIATQRLVERMANHRGISYLRTTRGKTPVIYDNDERFEIGGSKVLRRSDRDRYTLVAAGITLHEALAAHSILQNEGIAARVIDLYSIKPLDHATIRAAADATEMIFTIEDHVPEGGIGEAVLTSLADHPTPVRSLAVRKRPLSGSSERLLDDQGLSAQKIVAAVKAVADLN
ncbi:Transketolase 2 [Rosistilla carotiformis]|uniref:Transketolase 2 n=1 Tax=Rosistilla carotiformis TaxID=2528017 RepID=A0A518JPL9_9BACT|nr:transketolase [Rosistilla carotiformis]QDV67484.1 Transketolase 2 [Rosistilla carotiformis]